MGLARLYGFVFDNQGVLDFKASQAPGDPTVANNLLPVDAVDTLLASLRLPALPSVPQVSIPSNLQPIPLVVKTIDQLLTGLLNPVPGLFNDLGQVTGGLVVPVQLPPISLPTVDIGAVISLLRGAIDSALYNPAAKVSLDLKDVPSFLDFTVKEAASTKTGNPNETCGLVESDFVLPTMVYDSNGANRNALDLSGELDLAFLEPGAPRVIFDLANLADGFTITNTEEGKTYNLENPGETSGSVLVKVIPLGITLLDINWTGCPEPAGLVGWKSSGPATVAVNTQLRLQVANLIDGELKPGFSTGVSGSFGALTLGLPSPQFSITFAQNFLSGLHLRLSDDIQGTIPVLAAPNGTVSFPLPIVFHVAKQEAGPWISFITPVPCVVPGFQLTVNANIEPHRVNLETNQLTVPGGTWVATADPFGVGSGLSILFGGLDIIDSIAGLFTSPYDHGIRAPSLSCEFIF